MNGPDVVIWCCEADLDERSRGRDSRERARARNAAGRLISVTTKMDLASHRCGSSSVFVSAVSGEGVEQLREAVLSVLEQGPGRSHELIGSTAARCADSIRRASGAVSRARLLVQQCGGDELVAAELRAAVDEIGRMTGRIHSEDILDRIFNRFCIGK